MAIQLILMDDVEFLGKIGDTVTVRDGYARNYLLPKGLAEPLTKNALRNELFGFTGCGAVTD